MVTYQILVPFGGALTIRGRLILATQQRDPFQRMFKGTVGVLASNLQGVGARR